MCDCNCVSTADVRAIVETQLYAALTEMNRHATYKRVARTDRLIEAVSELATRPVKIDTA